MAVRLQVFDDMIEVKDYNINIFAHCIFFKRCRGPYFGESVMMFGAEGLSIMYHINRDDKISVEPYS